MKPEDALEAARSAAAAAGDADARALPGLRVEGSERVTLEQLMEFAVIEGDIDALRSTRAWGEPITRAKRLLLHVLRQYTREVEAQQTRFNFHAALRIAELEERVARMESAAERRGDQP